MRKAIIVALFFPALLSGMASPAEAAVLEGSVTNGTAGASVPSGLTVTVVQLDGGGNEVSRTPTTVDSAGRFRIEGLESRPGGRYVIGLEYQGVTYATNVATEGSSSALSAALTIYEVTEDDTAISVTSDTLTVVEGEEGEMEVFQLLRVRNGSDRTYIGRAAEGGRQVLALPVPSGAFDLAPGQGITASGISPSPEGFAISDPVLPGETQLSYLYRVRVPRTGWALERAVVYPTTRLNFLVGEGLELRAPRLAFAESVELRDRRYRRYQGGPLPAGSELIASVEPDTKVSPALPVGLAVLLGLGLVAALGGSWMLRRRRSRRGPPASARLAERERLIEQIAALDEDLAAGKIAADQHEKTRGRLKRKLATLTADLAAGGPPSRSHP